MVSYLSVTVLQHRRKACFCCCHPRVSSVGLTVTGIAWERNLKMVSDQSLSSASKPFLTHPLVRTSPITHPPQSGRGVFALVRKQCCVITPQLRGSRARCSSPGVRSTPPPPTKAHPVIIFSRVKNLSPRCAFVGVLR